MSIITNILQTHTTEELKDILYQICHVWGNLYKMMHNTSTVFHFAVMVQLMVQIWHLGFEYFSQYKYHVTSMKLEEIYKEQAYI